MVAEASCGLLVEVEDQREVMIEIEYKRLDTRGWIQETGYKRQCLISVPDDQPIISCLHNRLIILCCCRLVHGSEIC